MSSCSALSMVASSMDSGEVILITNVYAPVDFMGKVNLWMHIRHVRNFHPYLPWVLAGDFNSALSLEEKRGGLARLGPSSDLLRQNIDLLHLADIKPANGLFTWNNRRTGVDAISERLDRFLVSCFWVSGALTLSSEILDWRGSDHWPIKFSATGVIIPKSPPFKFQLMWLRDSSLHDLISNWWRDGAPAFGIAMFSLSKGLQYVKRQRKRWNIDCFGNLHSMKRLAQYRLDGITRQIQDLGFSEDLGKAESLASRAVEEWEVWEEIFWKQQARVDWL